MDAFGDNNVMLQVQRGIDEFLGEELNRMFGKPFVDLYKEQHVMIPHVEMKVHESQPLPDELHFLAELTFKDKVIKRKKFIVKKGPG